MSAMSCFYPHDPVDVSDWLHALPAERNAHGDRVITSAGRLDPEIGDART